MYWTWLEPSLVTGHRGLLLGARRNRIRSRLHQECRSGLSWDRSCSSSMTFLKKVFPRYVSGDLCLSSPQVWLVANFYLTWAGGSQGELIGWESSRRPSVRSSVNTFKHEYFCNQRPIVTRFYVKHHWDGGKAVLYFGLDRIGTLVSMATDSSHRVIMGKFLLALLRLHFWSDLLHTCRGNEDNRNISDEFELRPDSTKDCGVSCPWASKKKIPIYL